MQFPHFCRRCNAVYLLAAAYFEDEGKQCDVCASALAYIEDKDDVDEAKVKRGKRLLRNAGLEEA